MDGMRQTIFLACLMLFAATTWAEEPAVQRGALLWAVSDWNAGAGAGQVEQITPGHSVLRIEKADADGSALRQFELPVQKLRGRWIYLSANVKAKDVSDKPVDWNGIKVMLKIERQDGTDWPQIALPVGTFDWRKSSTRLLLPDDATAMTLLVGLERVSGTVWLDNVRITQGKTMRQAPPAPADQPIFKGHEEPVLRGVMVHPRVKREDLRVLAEQWHGNLIRYQLLHLPKLSEANDLAAYDRWLDGELAYLDDVLVWAKQLGIKVVVDLHSPPGGNVSSDGAMATSSGPFWSNRKAQDHFVQVWRKIAARYKGNAVIWGFDLLNEPDDRTVTADCDDWQALCERAARAVREVDEGRTLIVEPNSWAGADGFIGFAPLDLPRVVYSFHMYTPMAFTHQGVIGDGHAYAYPGEIDGRMWNKAALEKSMQAAIDFAAKYRVQMYVGEFSAARWAKGADRYLADVTAIFEKHGWDWSYHAFREWQGWNLELGTDRADTQPTDQPGARWRAIEHWMKLNQRAR